MKLELESLLNKYSQDIDLSDENKRSKLEIIKKITKNKDWDNIDIEGNKEYGLTKMKEKNMVLKQLIISTKIIN